MEPISAAEVSRLLSVREFMAVCQYFDYQYRGEAAQFMGGDLALASGVPVQRLAPRTPFTRFDVYEVRRTATTLNVICSRSDGGPMVDLDCSKFMRRARPVPVLVWERAA